MLHSPESLAGTNRLDALNTFDVLLSKKLGTKHQNIISQSVHINSDG